MDTLPKKPPSGTLREWHRRALCRAYVRGEQELSYDSGLGDGFGYVSWKTCLRLRDYQIKEQECALIREGRHHEPFGLVITDYGGQYYCESWKRYHEMDPGVDAPQPEDRRGESA